MIIPKGTGMNNNARRAVNSKREQIHSFINSLVTGENLDKHDVIEAIIDYLNSDVDDSTSSGVIRVTASYQFEDLTDDEVEDRMDDIIAQAEGAGFVDVVCEIDE